MRLGDVEAFVEVARQGTVSRAAEQLFVSQPALSARVHALESELGSALFARTRRGMRLTDAGRAFLPHAERALETLDSGARQLAELRTGASGVLVLGAPPNVGTYVLPVVLKRFSAAHPGIHLAVKTGHSEEVLELVLRGDVQVGLVRAMRHPDIDVVPVYEDGLVLVVPPGHRFGATAPIVLDDLADETLILYDRTSSYTDVIGALLRTAGVTPRGRMELDNFESTKKMVAQGLGVAFLPRTAVADELARGALREVRVSDTGPLRRQIVAVRRRDAGPPSVPVAAFLAMLGEIPSLVAELAGAERRRSSGPR